VMGVALWLTQQALFATPTHGTARAAALAALVGVGLVAYGAAVVMFGAADLRMLGRMVGRRTTGRTNVRSQGTLMTKQPPP
jgi:hypothetical protein